MSYNKNYVSNHKNINSSHTMEKAGVNLGFRGNRSQTWKRPLSCVSIAYICVLVWLVFSDWFHPHSEKYGTQLLFLVSHTSVPRGENGQCPLFKNKKRKEANNGYLPCCFPNLFKVIHNSLKFQSMLEHNYLETKLMKKFWKISWSFLFAPLLFA